MRGYSPTTDINYPQNIDPFDPGPFAAPLLSHAAVSRQHSIDLFDSGQIIIFHQPRFP